MKPNTQFKHFLDTHFPVQQEEEVIVVPVETFNQPQPILSDFIVGQWLHLMFIYITMVVGYVYTSGLVLGHYTKQLSEFTYNTGYTFGTNLHHLNEMVTEFVKLPHTQQLFEVIDYVIQQGHDLFQELTTQPGGTK